MVEIILVSPKHTRQAARMMTVISGHDDNALKGHTDVTDEELAEVGTILNLHRHFNMAVYKDKCMKRRVAIRIRLTNSRNAAEYCHLLRRNEHELDMLQKALTIHVSQFFRNPTMFDKLRYQVLPGLFASRIRGGYDSMRIVCLGCAGGEEPYSLAILLREYFSSEMRSIRVAIQGVDIDAETLRAAQQALYAEDHVKEVPVALKERYFRQDGLKFRLVPELRDMVSFRQADISDTSGYAPAVLVLCRNTLIYFARPDQEKILLGIADILPEGGIVVLGKSETLVGAVRRRFSPICPIERMYRKVQE
jgi:chemotaxis protein methyltransferase CheR